MEHCSNAAANGRGEERMPAQERLSIVDPTDGGSIFARIGVQTPVPRANAPGSS